MAKSSSSLVTLPTGGKGIPLHPFLGIDLREDPKYVKPGILLSSQNFVPYQQGTLQKRRGTTMRNQTEWAGVSRVPFALRFYDLDQASASKSPSASPSPSASQSPSASTSPSPSLSQSPSASVSPSASASPSLSPSASASPSASTSPSVSVSPSVSESPSPSLSQSPSASVSPSASTSPSSSPSESQSPSASTSPSASESPSASLSPSLSPSASVSPSASPSPAATGPWTLAYVNKATGDVIGSVEDTTGYFRPLDGLPTLQPNKRCRGTIFGEVPAAYFGNDANGILVSRDGETIEQLTGTQIPTACYVGGPFYDRLLAWHGKRLYYSRTNIPNDFSDPNTGNQQYVLVQHPEDITVAFTPGPDRTEVGFMGKLFVCTPTSTWIKNQDFGTGTLTKIHETAGVAAMNTVAWTDRGAVGLGNDDVWIFPLDGLPIAIGGAIKPILEAIPQAYRYRCSAVFRRGFYMLSVVPEGSADPTVEYWCDLRAFNANREDKGIYWIGPMVRGTSGKGVECWLYQSQFPDEYELLAFGSTEGRMSLCEDESTFLDYGETMTSIDQSQDVDGSVPMEKGFPGVLLGVYATDVDQITIDYGVNENEVEGQVIAEVGAGQGIFDESNFDEAVWAGPSYYLIHKLFLDRPVGQKIRLAVTHTSDQDFSIKELFAVVEPFGRI